MIISFIGFFFNIFIINYTSIFNFFIIFASKYTNQHVIDLEFLTDLIKYI